MNAEIQTTQNYPSRTRNDLDGVQIDNYSTRKLMYKNALAIFGLVPMFGLLVEYDKRDKETGNGIFKLEISLIKSAMESFKDPHNRKLLNLTQNNQIFFKGEKPVPQNDLKIIDMALLDLGYYEKYDSRNIERDMLEIIRFVNSQGEI